MAGEMSLKHNQILKDAIGPIMECSEEPMLKQINNADYAVWRKQSERTLYASGKPFMLLTRYKIEAFLQPGADGQGVAGQVAQNLRKAGLESVRELSRPYDLDMGKRMLNFVATVREAVE